MKDVLKLQKMLAPASALHRTLEVKKLSACVAEVKELSCRFPATTAKEWEWDLDIAMKGIVQERKVVLKAPKPDLIVEADLCF